MHDCLSDVPVKAVRPRQLPSPTGGAGTPAPALPVGRLFRPGRKAPS